MPKLDTGVGARVIIRDTINRLQTIRIKCGKTDDADAPIESTGDPFRDLANRFSRVAKQTRDMIAERNANQLKKVGIASDRAEDSHAINSAFKEMREVRRSMQDLIKDSTDHFAKHAKKGRQDKMAKYEKEEKERREAYNSTEGVLRALEDLNADRFKSKKEIETAKAIAAAEAKGTARFGRYSETLASRTRRGVKVDESGAVEGEGSTRLEDDPETAEAMKALEAKKKREEQQLDLILKGLGRINEIAVNIGTQLDQQDAMLKDAEDKADRINEDLKGLNKGLTKLMKDQKPMGVFIKVIFVALILGMIGYFLVEFGAV